MCGVLMLGVFFGGAVSTATKSDDWGAVAMLGTWIIGYLVEQAKSGGDK